jgi:hypothetical protein
MLVMGLPDGNEPGFSGELQGNDSINDIAGKIFDDEIEIGFHVVKCLDDGNVGVPDLVGFDGPDTERIPRFSFSNPRKPEEMNVFIPRGKAGEELGGLLGVIRQ